MRQARREGLLSSDYLGEQIGEAEKAQVISKAEARNMRSYHNKVLALLAVDDFAPDELSRYTRKPEPAATKPIQSKTAVTKTAAAKKSSKKKTARKTSKSQEKA